MTSCIEVPAKASVPIDITEDASAPLQGSREGNRCSVQAPSRCTSALQIRRTPRSLDDSGVGPATAEISAYSQSDLFHGRMGFLSQKALHCHDLARCAVSALEGVILDKGLLNRTEFFFLHPSSVLIVPSSIATLVALFVVTGKMTRHETKFLGPSLHNLTLAQDGGSRKSPAQMKVRKWNRTGFNGQGQQGLTLYRWFDKDTVPLQDEARGGYGHYGRHRSGVAGMEIA